MTLKSTVSFLIITLLLAARAATPTATQPVVTEVHSVTSRLDQHTCHVSGTWVSIPVVHTTSTYPAPGTPGYGHPAIPPSGYEPQPGDRKAEAWPGVPGGGEQLRGDPGELSSPGECDPERQPV